MYKTLGCFHSLQPTSNPFETPSIPALLPIGFVEWQRVQLLLCPGEHVPYMQEAVRRYDVPKLDGGIFPKHIPREAFPDRPDKGMEEWYRMVTGSLEQAQYTRGLKNSPYPSPRDASHRAEGSLANGKLSHARRPSRSPRSQSHSLDPARLDDERRRSSVPDIPSPFPPVSETTYRSGDSRTKQAPYNAQHGASKASSHHRTSDTSSSRHRYSSSSHLTSNSSATYRPTLSSSKESTKHGPPPVHHTRRRGRSPSTIDESSSGSEASSEDSQARRGRNSRETRDDRRRSSLIPPDLTRHHYRRHSHDATYRPADKPPLPPRPIANSPHVHDPLLLRRPGSGYKNGPTSGAAPLQYNPVQFRSNVFENQSDEAFNSAPESPFASETLGPSINPKLHSFDPVGPRELVQQYDPAGIDQGQASPRQPGMPLRTSTVTGVRGRRYAATDPRNAFPESRPPPTKQLGMVGMGDGR